MGMPELAQWVDSALTGWAKTASGRMPEPPLGGSIGAVKRGEGGAKGRRKWGGWEKGACGAKVMGTRVPRVC